MDDGGGQERSVFIDRGCIDYLYKKMNGASGLNKKANVKSFLASTEITSAGCKNTKNHPKIITKPLKRS